MTSVVVMLLCAFSPAVALLGSPGAPAPKGLSSITSRKAVLGAAAGASISFALSPAAASAKDKGYMTMDEYNALKRKEKEDEKLYGLFEALRSRASQTGEFDSLANDGKFSELSKLALAWDSTIRQQLLDEATKQLSGSDKSAGGAISKKVLDDLKSLDKLAKAGTKDEVPTVSAALRGHVLEFVALEPTRLADKYGIGDL